MVYVLVGYGSSTQGKIGLTGIIDESKPSTSIFINENSIKTVVDDIKNRIYKYRKRNITANWIY